MTYQQLSQSEPVGEGGHWSLAPDIWLQYYKGPWAAVAQLVDR